MSMSEQFVIFASEGPWRVARVRDGAAEPVGVAAAEGASPAEHAGAARAALAELGHRGQPLLLALPSAWCLSAVISTDDLERGGRRRAMAFRLEEHLPIAAEDFVADFLETRSGEALGVCAEYDRLHGIVDALEAADLEVRHICPAALLAAADAAESVADVAGVLLASTGPPASADAEASAADFNLVELDRGRPVRWWWFAGDAEALQSRLAAWAAGSDAALRLVTLEAEESDAPAIALPETVEPVVLTQPTVEEAAALHAARVLDGLADPWIDLRCDKLARPDQHELYRRPVIACVAAVVLLLVSLTAAMHWRGRQYQQLTDRYEQQQIAAFRAALPDQPVPSTSVLKRRLESEQQKLAHISGEAAGASAGEPLQPTSALVHLRTVLAAFPPDLRVRLLGLDIRPEVIRIDGQSRSHADADRIAGALRGTGVYDVDQPRTRALEDRGVSFLFTAEPRPDAGSLAEGGRP